MEFDLKLSPLQRDRGASGAGAGRSPGGGAGTGRKVAPDVLAKWALIVSGVITAIYAVTSSALPFGWDQGMMASADSSWVHGGLPYVNGWEIKGPLFFLPYALVQVLFAPTMWGVRIFDVIVGVIVSFTFYKWVRTLTTWRIGAWTAFALYYWIAAAGWFYTAAPDPWTGFFCVIAILPLLASDKEFGNWRLAPSGSLVGCVGLIKPLYLVIGIAPLLSVMLTQGFTPRRHAGLVLVLAADAVAPIVLVYGYLAWRGGLSQAIETNIPYPLSTDAHVSVGTTAVQGFADFFARPTVALLAPFVALGLWAFRRQPQLLWPALGWLVAMAFAVAAQGKYFRAHWLPVYPRLVLLAALGVHALARVDVKGGAPLIAALGAALTLAAQVCALLLHDAAKCIYHLAVKHVPDRYCAFFDFFHTYNAEDERAAASYIAARTNYDDGVFVWGNDATVRYLANRSIPSRFTYEMPLSLQGPYLAPYGERYDKPGKMSWCRSG